MMASLVETASELLAGDEDRLRYMSFSEAMMAAEEFSSPLYDLHDETWRELYLRPSPPVSPDCLSPAADNSSPVTISLPEQSSSSSSCSAAACCCGNGTDITGATDSLLQCCCNMEYDQIMDALHEAEFALTASQPTEDLLIQDCMWSGASSETADSKVTGASDTTAASPELTAGTGKSVCRQPAEPSSSDCVEPSVVFPTLHHATPHSIKVPNASSTGPQIVNRMRSAPSSSESEEEIDVVTVEHRNDQQHNTDHLPVSHRTTSSNSSSKSPSVSNHHQTKNIKKTQAPVAPQRTANTGVAGKIPTRRKRHTKRHSRLGSQDGNESDEEARRASHNVLERKRRNDLKNSFDVLRTGIPDLEENVRAPKVVILRKAVEYIKALQGNDRKIECDWLREQKRFNRLKERLTYLKSSPVVAI